jgi:SAM-dependent methyltransferase
MATGAESYNAQDYESRYKQGYGLQYPESHVIRVHKHVLEWELGIRGGSVFDFGCGAGANLRYFAEQSFVPHGCDTSATAVAACKRAMPRFADNFHVSSVHPDLMRLAGKGKLDVFFSNQVLYFLTDDAIRDVVRQAHALVRPGGVFVATMMSWSCFYSHHIVGKEGDFRRVELNTPRQKMSTLINFKEGRELPALFAPFRKLHLGSYGSWVREEEGSTDHWMFVGVRD